MGGNLSFTTVCTFYYNLYYNYCFCELLSLTLSDLFAAVGLDTLRRLAPNIKRFANVVLLLVLLVRLILLAASEFIFSRSALSCSNALLPTKLFNIAIRFCRCSYCARCNCRFYGIAIPDAAASAITLFSVVLPSVVALFANYIMPFSGLLVFCPFSVWCYKRTFTTVDGGSGSGGAGREVAFCTCTLLELATLFTGYVVFINVPSFCCAILVSICVFASNCFVYVFIGAVTEAVVMRGIFTSLIGCGLQRCVRRSETE